MKLKTVIFITLCFFMISCIKEKTAKIETPVQTIPEVEEKTEITKEIVKEYYYVRPQNGIELKSEPNENSETLTTLQLNSKLEFIKIDFNSTCIINGVEFRWYNVKTESGITGYVCAFSVEKDPEQIRHINNLEGRFIPDDTYKRDTFKSITLNYLGKGKFKIIPELRFEINEFEIDLEKILSYGILLADYSGIGMRSGEMIVRYDKENGQLNYTDEESRYSFPDDESEEPILTYHYKEESKLIKQIN